MILVYGTICLDRIHIVPRLPDPGGYVEIQRSERHLGGEALNTAGALAKWGADVRLAGNPLGGSSDAAWIIEQIQLLNLPEPELPWEEIDVPTCDLYVTPDGQRTMFGSGFSKSESLSRPDEVSLTGVDFVTVDGVPLSASQSLINRAIRTSAVVYAMDVPVSVQLRAGDYWQTSTNSMGTPGDIQKNVVLVNEIVKQLACFVILSDGANGFVAGGPQKTVRHYPPFPAKIVVDSTGAGDSFRAGMLYGLSQGWELPDCLRFASATGSINCRAVGALEGLPSVAEAEELVSAHPEVARSYD